MNLLKRTKLIRASAKLTSSYKKKGNKQERWDVTVFKDGANICPDMASALLELDKWVNLRGGTLYITDLYRSWETQASARKDFETKKKKAFVAKPGSSFHNAGRAIDISVKELNFDSTDKSDWLQKFWDIAKPLGFTPVISISDIDASEAWHFDFLGDDWSHCKNNISYSEIAKAATLDIGGWDPEIESIKLRNMFLQSQLIRLKQYYIGNIDGIIGSKTLDGLKNLNLDHLSIEFAIEELIKK